VTLIKHKYNGRALYLHDSDTIFSSSPSSCLSPNCPLNTVLLGQAVIDKCGSEGYKMHVLVFDALAIGNQDFVSMKMEPQERYRRLRELWNAPAGITSSISFFFWMPG
jgi:hypothetical protein